MDDVFLDVHEVGDVFIAVVEVVGFFAGGREEDEGAGGDGFRGIPNVGLEESVICATELLDAEKVVVDKAEVRGDLIISHLLIVHAAAKTVKGHRDHGITGFPPNGAIFGVIND